MSLFNQEPTLRLRLVSTDDGAAAEVTYEPRASVTNASIVTGRPGTMVGKGMAKRHPKDRPNPMIGDHYAVGRALIELGELLCRDAERRAHPPMITARDFEMWGAAAARLDKGFLASMINNA